MHFMGPMLLCWGQSVAGVLRIEYGLHGFLMSRDLLLPHACSITLVDHSTGFRVDGRSHQAFDIERDHHELARHLSSCRTYRPACRILRPARRPREFGQLLSSLADDQHGEDCLVGALFVEEGEAGLGRGVLGLGDLDALLAEGAREMHGVHRLTSLPLWGRLPSAHAA